LEVDVFYPSIKDGDIFPEEFKGNVYRKDRKSDHHGGVFVAIKNTFDSEEAEELKSTASINSWWISAFLLFSLTCMLSRSSQFISGRLKSPPIQTVCCHCLKPA
jgi:hypothetical protein